MEEPEIDPNETLNDPNGQPSSADRGNGGGGADNGGQSPTDFIDLEGVKVPSTAFEKLARERYKEAFEAQENRDKWQAENTRKAQENAEKIRKAELYERMIAEGRLRQEVPQNPYEAQKREYIDEMKREFPDVDERFFSKQFDWNVKLAESKGREIVEPLYQQSGESFEKEFLAAHPKVVKGSEQYQQIARLMGAGVDPETAYKTVFQEDIVKERLSKELETAIKARDEEAKRKLQNSRQTSKSSGTPAKGKNFEERAWSIIDRMRN